MLLLGNPRSPFRDFESYLRILVGSDEDDLRLILKEEKSNSVTYEIPSGIYSMKNISDVVYTKDDHDGTLKIDYDDINLKTKLILKRFG